MVEKKFCDYCGVDLKINPNYSIDLYDNIAEKYLLEKDVCKSCVKKIKQILKEKEFNI